jgi:hypothetical protein
MTSPQSVGAAAHDEPAASNGGSCDVFMLVPVAYETARRVHRQEHH